MYYKVYYIYIYPWYQSYDIYESDDKKLSKCKQEEGQNEEVFPSLLMYWDKVYNCVFYQTNYKYFHLRQSDEQHHHVAHTSQLPP